MKRSLSLLFTALFAFAHSGRAAATESEYIAQGSAALAVAQPPTIATGLTMCLGALGAIFSGAGIGYYAKRKTHRKPAQRSLSVPYVR